MNHLIKSIEGEFLRYRTLGEGALAQVPEPMLSAAGPGNGNSLAVICWHVAGNLHSRFTNFLTEDGEKPSRVREEEFVQRSVSREELMAKWNLGWDVLLATLQSLDDTDLFKVITIRQQPLTVHEALHRAVAHVSYHVGQIVYVSHAACGAGWHYLSIPPGGSDAYNAAPAFDKPAAHAEKIRAQSNSAAR